MSRPNFFLIGFPKCGTTAIARSLSRHADVYIPASNEPHYFAADLTNRQISKITTERQYTALFSGIRNELSIGERSNGYIYSNVALENIERYCDDPKYIIVVRNPVDMVQSLHAQMLRDGKETIESFSKAWRMSDSRMRGKGLWLRNTDRILVSYKELGRVYKYVRRVFDVVDHERIHVVIYDDLIMDPRREYRKILEFLGVSDDGRSIDEKVNIRSYHRTRLLAKFVNKPPARLMRWHSLWKRAFGVKRVGFIKWLRQKNLRTQRREIDLSLRVAIREQFRDEVKSLESLLGRRLDW